MKLQERKEEKKMKKFEKFEDLIKAIAEGEEFVKETDIEPWFKVGDVLEIKPFYDLSMLGILFDGDDLKKNGVEVLDVKESRRWGYEITSKEGYILPIECFLRGAFHNEHDREYDKNVILNFLYELIDVLEEEEDEI